jgi:hypothetical protein
MGVAYVWVGLVGNEGGGLLLVERGGIVYNVEAL